MHAEDAEDSSDQEDAGEEATGRFSEAQALEFVLKHKESVGEVRELCGDLQVSPPTCGGQFSAESAVPCLTDVAMRQSESGRTIIV